MFYDIFYIFIVIIYVLVLPGILLSFIFFRPSQIDWIERVALSLALSLSIIPLIAFYANLLGIKISTESITMEVFIVICAETFILIFKYGFQISHKIETIIYTKSSHLEDNEHLTKGHLLPKNAIVKTLNIITKEIFQVSLITYLILLLAETVQEGFVSYFFNLNILLALVLVSGIIMTITHFEEIESLLPNASYLNWDYILHALNRNEKKSKQERLSQWEWIYILVISIASGLLVNYKTLDLEAISIYITIATMIIVALLSYLILTEKD